ncbi:PrpR N-terminal domain-containing protein [Aneurinibacillus sp. Ricciae_BoGa-3]|uniref:sigma-54-dependent Fis family transcriptional regulator n=1 Tax=Aneurinibacillus sp. Ricciae_BoGa-3 TaxID=3022697 RepID=UPI00233FDDF5|nr:sigma-54-dependent transcriptional regulator [Aneurinibacillus sp. Ricciae_BoGa-3]WCK52651.1 PrpR N-terminal domain-containing protein [Aneurinibacillus sp. Ricciae_BoGa-3]
MAVKVLAVLPYPGLQDLIQDKTRNVPGIVIECIVADLKEALPFVENAEQNGYDVILSRGGTAELIRKSVSLPVVDIPVSGYDILRVLTLVKDSNVPTAIIGFQNICNGASTVSNLLNFTLPIYTVEAEEQVAETLETAFNKGARVVLGDVVTVKTAEAFGYQGVLITSGPESVEKAIEEVQQVYDIYKKGQEESGFFETILNTVPQAVVVIGSDDKVKFANAAANRFIKGQHKNINSGILAAPPELSECIAGLKKNALEYWQGHLQLGNVVASITIQTMDWRDHSYFLLSMEELPKGKDVPVSRPPLVMGSFSQISASSPAMQQLIKQAKAFALADKNIWISGEPGTEKNILAEAIHMASNRKAYAFYTVNCGIISEKRVMNLLFGSDEQDGLLEQAAKTTLFMDEIEKLSCELQEKLWKRLKSTEAAVRIIASSDLQMGPLLKSGFHKRLAEEIAKFHIHIPPLRTRLEDIEGIILLMISAHNAKYGKQIAGIRENVLNQIKSYEWPGNTAEFKTLIEEILILTDGDFVEMEQFQQVWKRFERVEEKRVLPFLAGTLKEMEKAMIQYVLHEEGMNQSKAAKRLGITRATLWRKLKE